MTATRSVARHAAQVVLGAVVLAAAAALMVRALGLTAAARRLLGLRFDYAGEDSGAALEIAASNLQLVGACVVAAWAVRRRSQLRPVLDGVLVTVLVVNATAIGLTVGGYGGRALWSLAAHGPPELAAFALAGGSYLTARAGALSIELLSAAAAAVVGLIAVAAVLETYIEMGGAR